MTLDPSVFKAYDVRGIVPDELDADGVYRTVRAYVDEFEPRSMAIGRDMRLTSPSCASRPSRRRSTAAATSTRSASWARRCSITPSASTATTAA